MKNLNDFNTTGFMLPLRIWLLENERSGSWLARKLDISPASVHYWFEGTPKASVKNRSKIQEITGIKI